MSKNKPPQVAKKNEVSIVRSSAAEYLTFVAATGNGNASVEMRYEDENLWLTQKMMATLYDVSVPAISQHLKRIYADNELEREATVKQYLTVQNEGDREVQRKVDHYSLQAIIAVGFKIENERAVQFRKWANQIVKDYTIQGWVMDVDRLKSGGRPPTPRARHQDRCAHHRFRRHRPSGAAADVGQTPARLPGDGIQNRGMISANRRHPQRYSLVPIASRSVVNCTPPVVPSLTAMWGFFFSVSWHTHGTLAEKKTIPF